MNRNVSVMMGTALLVLVLLFAMSVLPRDTAGTPAAASDARVAMVILAGQSAGQTRGLTRVYAEADDSSRIVGVIAPGSEVSIAGRSADGRFIALTGESAGVAGYAAAQDVRTVTASARTESLVKVFADAGMQGEVVDVLTPARQVQVLGRSADGQAYAIAAQDGRGLTGWVAASAIRRPAAKAQTRELVKVYRQTAETAPVVDILPPAQSVEVTGRSADGQWLAIAQANGRMVQGWVRVQGVALENTTAALPVISTR